MSPPTTTHSPEDVASRIKAAYPTADAMGLSMAELYAVADITPQEGETFFRSPGAIESLEAEKIRASAKGATLEPLALHLMQKVLERIALQIEDMDAFQAAEVSKPLLRILEAADRRRAAVKDSREDLPMVHITITQGGGINLRSVERDKTPNTGDIIDIDASPFDDDAAMFGSA